MRNETREFRRLLKENLLAFTEVSFLELNPRPSSRPTGTSRSSQRHSWTTFTVGPGG